MTWIQPVIAQKDFTPISYLLSRALARESRGLWMNCQNLCSLCPSTFEIPARWVALICYAWNVLCQGAKFIFGLEDFPLPIYRSAISLDLTWSTGKGTLMRVCGHASSYLSDGCSKSFVKNFKPSRHAHLMRNLQLFGTIYLWSLTSVANFTWKRRTFLLVINSRFSAISDVFNFKASLKT
jgi:hypothetical protein